MNESILDYLDNLQRPKVPMAVTAPPIAASGVEAGEIGVLELDPVAKIEELANVHAHESVERHGGQAVGEGEARALQVDWRGQVSGAQLEGLHVGDDVTSLRHAL